MGNQMTEGWEFSKVPDGGAGVSTTPELHLQERDGAPDHMSKSSICVHGMGEARRSYNFDLKCVFLLCVC